MHVSQPPSTPANQPVYFDNRSLFSDYYLRERLSDHKEWSEDVTQAFEKARRLYRDKRDILHGLNEAQTEDEFVRPLLRDVLGFEFEVQTAVSRHGRLNRPDYALFTRRQAKTEAQRLREQEAAYYARATAVADAKYWGRPLDRKVDDPRDELSNTNPSFQIVNYLVATDVDWGILTNGQLWRLYYARARSRIDTYFEVDLAQILESGNAEAFRYFYLFFRAPAFEKDPQTDRSFLEAVYDGSVTYGTELEKRLKDLIFEQVFVYLSTGFLEYRRGNGIAAVETQESLNEIYQGTLRLLYRLLFLLHAEARGLLPVDDRHGYYGYSLTRLKRDVAERIDTGRTLSPVSTDIWNDLAGLFRIIDRGDPALNVPRYNGGLFRRDDPKNDFLNTHRMADAYLAPALDLLTRERDPKTGQHRFIDYKTLNVEQLGSIYEGLLEFHLEIGDSRLEIDGVESPQSPIYLVNDKGERKATGSYYTPHYIVEYIVEHTLGPVLEERAGCFRQLMAKIEPRRQRLAEVEARLAEDPDRADAWVSRWRSESQGLRRELDRLEREAVDALLGIRVCDPAMGSGHFLVYATDWLAEHLIAVLNEFPENPVLRHIAGIRQQIVDELTRQGIDVDPERLKDANLLKRMVMKRCIYGVDLNPMATELAKLSLWLDSFTVGAPLSFLDHHLKVGNSLIGTRVEEVRQALEAEDTGQIHMFGGPFAGLLTATSLMRDVAVRTDATFEEVEQSAEKYAAFEQAMLPYKRVLDLWVSRHFGNKHAEEFLRLYGHEALTAVVNEGVDLAPEYREAVDRTRAAWQEKRFFHWELEFPEVFIDLERSNWKQNPGFDAVVGNPPYGLTEVLPRFSNLPNDAFVYFWKVGIDKVRNEGYLSLITPTAWLTGVSYQGLRRMLLEQSQIHTVVGLPYDIFPDAYIDTCIAVLEVGRPTTELVQVKKMGKREEGRGVGQLTYDRVHSSLWQSDPYNKFLLVPAVANLQRFRVLPDFTTLGQIIRVERGVQPYSRSKHTEEQIRSDFLRRYHPPPEEEAHLYYPELRGEELSRYRIMPAKRTWLKYSDELAGKRDEEYFTRPRVVLRRLLSRRQELMAALTSEKLITTDNILNILVEADGYSEGYIVALLNSKLIAWIYTHTSTIAVKDDFPQVTYEELNSLPIRRIEFTTLTDTRAALVEHGRRLYNRYLAGHDPAGILSFVEDQLSHEPERADVVHDLLAFLAERMIELNKQRQRLEKALDPFKFLDRGAPFVKLPDAFADEIKYGHLVQTSEVSETSEVCDLSTVRHDIDGLRLVPAGSQWELQLRVKLRDPAKDWQAWQYDDSNTIAREWAPAYRLPLSDQKARYYQHAFQVLSQFANARSFPGGYTRTTMKKLQLTCVPAFDPDADLTPLVELSEELAGVRDQTARTDELIDQIVYRLYGLTEEEIAVVEGRVRA